MATSAVGVLLAAGAGRRAGGPKALRHEPDGTSWLVRSVSVLIDGGCDSVVVVLGGGAGAARAILEQHSWPAGVADRLAVTVEPGWADGMGRSLRAGLQATGSAVAVLVHLVDLPDVNADVVRRLLDYAAPTALARATYLGEPGHPVLIGHDHLGSVIAELDGDRGARAYLERHRAVGVECGDLATGQDRDWSAPAATGDTGPRKGD